MSRSVEPPALGMCWNISGLLSEGTAPNAAHAKATRPSAGACGSRHVRRRESHVMGGGRGRAAPRWSCASTMFGMISISRPAITVMRCRRYAVVGNQRRDCCCMPRRRETTISTSGNRDTTRCDTNFVVNYLLFISTLNTQRLARPEVALSIEESICEDDDGAGAQDMHMQTCACTCGSERP